MYNRLGIRTVEIGEPASFTRAKIGYKTGNGIAVAVATGFHSISISTGIGSDPVAATLC
jgi:hypothetical protein